MVAQILNDKHAERAAQINADRKRPPDFQVGDQVWYLRPDGSGTKLDTRWIGPGKVTAKVGEHSYEIRIAPDSIIAAHATFLKKHKPDNFRGEGVPLWTSGMWAGCWNIASIPKGNGFSKCSGRGLPRRKPRGSQ